MSNRLDRYRAALILVEAAFSSDKIASEVFGCSSRTISNYRKLLETDKELQGEYRLALYNKTKEWTKNIPSALKNGMEFIDRSLKDLCPSDPKALDAVINTMQVLTEIEIMNEAVRIKFTNGK